MIVELIVVFALGALTGFAELIGRYRDEPMRAVAARPGLAYMLINALAAVAALAVIRAFDWRFGLAADASDAAVATVQVLVAGLAAAALFRTSLFTARVGDQDVGVGPSAVLDALLRTVDRAVDRRRGIERLAVVAELPKTLSFENDAVALASYATASLQNLSLAEAEALGNKGNELRLNEDIDDAAKLRTFALDLMRLVGEAGLRAAIAQLAEAAPAVAPAEEEPEPAVEYVEGPEPAEPPPPVLPPPRIAPLAQSEEQLRRLISTLRDVVRMSPDLAESRLALGRASALLAAIEQRKPYGSQYLELFRESRYAILQALELRPTFADAYLELGRVSTVERYGERKAEIHLHSALRFAEAPEIEAAAAHQLAVLNVVHHDSPEGSARWLEHAIATGGSPPEWRIACSALHVRLHDVALATAQMEAAVEAHPDHGPTWMWLGLLRFDTDVEAAAAALARGGEVMELEGDAAHVRRVGEGVAYQRMGNATAAVETLAPELTPYLPGATEIDALEATGDGEKPPWRDLERVAKAVCAGVLVTHLGEPVIRAEPEPVEEPAGPVAEQA